MHLSDHLVDLFNFNDAVNARLFERIGELKDQSECLRLASHLVNSQNKWMARLMDGERAAAMNWWDPLYSLEELPEAWSKSLGRWIEFIDGRTDEDLQTERHFIGHDGGMWAATPKDIALQLNFHSVHHRAQMQTIIRNSGLEPDFVDYIGTRYRKVD